MSDGDHSQVSDDSDSVISVGRHDILLVESIAELRECKAALKALKQDNRELRQKLKRAEQELESANEDLEAEKEAFRVAETRIGVLKEVHGRLTANYSVRVFGEWLQGEIDNAK
jgi:chromosome segregation ATPase